MAGLVLAVALAAGCEFLVSLDALDNGVCRPDEKLCEGKCFKLHNASTGCGDPNRCTPCFLPNEISICVADTGGNFVCQRDPSHSCTGGYTDCVTDDLDHPETVGCETDTGHSVDNCGTCGHVCQPQANAYAGCSQGQCALDGCVPGFADCDGRYDTGCEANIWTDQRCGDGCNSQACPAGQSCDHGTCR